MQEQKSKNVLPGHLMTAWKSKMAKKKCKNVLISPNSMAFRTENGLKSKNARWEKVYILGKDVNTEFEEKISLKKAYFLVRPNSNRYSQIAWIFFYKMFIL